jgi:hypothetical protein
MAPNALQAQGFLGETAAVVTGAPEAQLYVAIAQTTEAVQSGQAGNPARLIDHVGAALFHAQNWGRIYPNRNTDMAVADLRASLAAARKLDITAATRRAERALSYLEATRP